MTGDVKTNYYYLSIFRSLRQIFKLSKLYRSDPFVSFLSIFHKVIRKKTAETARPISVFVSTSIEDLADMGQRMKLFFSLETN